MFKYIKKQTNKRRRDNEDEDEDEDDEHPFKVIEGRNVHLITTLSKWEEKISEAIRDSKPVLLPTLFSSFFFLVYIIN